MQELRPMGIGDILDTTFRLYRQRFVTFLLIALVVYVPFALVQTLLQSSISQPSPQEIQQQFRIGSNPYGPNMRQHPPTVPQINWTIYAVSMLGTFLFLFVFVPLCHAAMIHNISASYLGESLSAAESYGRATPRLLGLLGSQILAGLIVVLGLLMLIVPGIIFAFWFYVVAPVVVLEGISGTSALGRSRELMRGNIGKAFLLGLVLAILGGIIGAILGAINGFIPWPHPAIATFFQTLIQAVVLPIQTAAVILFYYDLRIRKEAFDLQKLSESLGRPAAAQ